MAEKSQSEKFKDAARELGADEDEKHWEERLKKIAKQGHVGASRERLKDSEDLLRDTKPE